MNRCVALLRGIGPGNPNMRNEHLRRVSEGVGLENVATVISSGNVVFSTKRDDLPKLEETLEKAWLEELGFVSDTIIRTRADLEGLVSLAPFGDLEHNRETYLLVTFAKHPWPEEADWSVPGGAGFEVAAVTDRELFTVTDVTTHSSLDVMSWAESARGKQITSRTWLTVSRILKKMG